jgi:hypothetical protein
VKEVMRMNEIIAMALFLVCATGYMLIVSNANKKK